MSTAPGTSQLAVVTAGEPTLFDSLARLVPEELRAEYYRVLAHTRTLSPDDEMLRILEAMGTLALLTRHTPKDIADERERFQEMFELHQQLSDETREKMLDYVHVLDSRISALPSKLEASLDPKQIAKLLGESLRQNFLKSGILATAEGLQAASTAMASSQQELSSALRKLSESQSGVIAQVEYANNQLTYSLESRAKTIDALLHEWKSDVLRIWMPLVFGAALLIGLFSGMCIQGWRDSVPAAAATPTPTAVQAVPAPAPQEDAVRVGDTKKPHRVQAKANTGTEHER
jgi:predicted secreted protein